MRSEERRWKTRGARWGALLCGAAFAVLTGTGCGLDESAEDQLMSEELRDGLGDYFGDPNEAGACTIELDGDARTCRSNAQWEQVAQRGCRAKGMRLVAFKAFRPCGRGEFSRVAYACCPDRPPPPPPPGPMCFEGDLGTNGACVDARRLEAQARQICESKRFKLAKFSPVRPCGMAMDSFQGAHYACCGGAPPPPPPPMCFEGTISSPMGACKGADDLKLEAQKICDSKNLKLAKFSPERPCGMGSTYLAAVYACCGDTPPPPPPGPMCFEGTISSPMGTCQTADVLNREAQGICASKMMKLAKFSPERPCGMGGYQAAIYACCGDAPPPPPGPMCVEETLRNDTGICKDSRTLEAEAAMMCAGKGLKLAKLAPQRPCGMDRYLTALYVCCSDAPPPPPPMCFDGTLSSPMGACRDEASFRAEAERTCASKMMKLAKFAVDSACGMGGYLRAVFGCCL